MLRSILQLPQQGNVGRRFGLVDFELFESESSHSNASNFDKSDNEELIKACSYQYAPCEHVPLALSAKILITMKRKTWSDES